jgi:phage baseplate assembly protein W
MDRETGKVLHGWDHTVQSMRVIFLTRYHERVLRRYVGSFVPHLLGESAVERAITRFYWAIATAIDLWEPNYRIQKVSVATTENGQQLTSAEELRHGNLTTRMDGVHRPRAHLGDNTPEQRRGIGLIGRGYHAWDLRTRL